MASIDKSIVEQLIILLKPFKHVVQIVQTGNTPSLYMVLVCTLTLREALASFDSLMKYNQDTSPRENSLTSAATISDPGFDQVDDLNEDEGEGDKRSLERRV